MKRVGVFCALVAAALLAACGSPLRSSQTPSPSGETASPVQAWASHGIDPAPGPVVTGMIASTIGVSPEDVVAAVFLLHHPAGNGAGIWVFRAGGLSSQEALERWVAGEQRCGGSTPQLALAGREAVVIQRSFIDQCQPRYLVKLDDQTLAIITDDGGYSGNAGPTRSLPYRPASDIAWVVRWVEEALKTVKLEPGGPLPSNWG
jgi:hypothetical protein